MLLKAVFCLQIPRSKSAGNHGALRAKSTNFLGLVFIPKTDKLLLWHLKWKGKPLIDVKVASEWKIKENGALKLFL